MLAIFEKSVAKTPQALESPEALKDDFLSKHFTSTHPNAVTVNFGSSGFISHSLHTHNNPLLPSFIVDDIFCVFQGHIDNVAFLKQQYGLNKTATEVSIVIEAFRTLRDRGPYPVDQVVRHLQGRFVFILYDCFTKTVFLAVDADGSVPFFWGTDAEGFRHCEEGLREIICSISQRMFLYIIWSYEHPLNELKPVPRVDSSGQVCGAIFKVDSEAKKESSMPRVGSVQNWSQQL